MKLAFTGGGTLGPVTPLIAVIEELRQTRPDVEAFWIGTKGGIEESVVREAGLAFIAIDAGKLRRYASLRNVTDVLRTLRGIGQAWRILGAERPAAVASAGGFVAVPVVVAAWLRGIPVHIHQLDLRPGLANRISALFASSASVSFRELAAAFRRLKPVWTGTPIRPRVRAGAAAEAVRMFSLEQGSPTLVVLGGGTGAYAINHLVAEALPRLTSQFQVIHVTGQGKEIAIPQPSSRYHPFPFLGKELPHAFAAADLVVTRAGIGTLAELACLGVPALIVPMPGTHQEDNARYFAGHGAGIVFAQKLGPDEFAAQVEKLFAERAAYGRKDDSVLCNQDAAREVGEALLRLAEKKAAG